MDGLERPTPRPGETTTPAIPSCCSTATFPPDVVRSWMRDRRVLAGAGLVVGGSGVALGWDWAANRLGGTLSSDVRLRSLHDRARASAEFRQPWNGSRRADQPDRPEFIVMTGSLRIVLACAIALLAIGMGGLAALMLIPSPPQTRGAGRIPQILRPAHCR